jgi:signal transduction histidine kinase
MPARGLAVILFAAIVGAFTAAHAALEQASVLILLPGQPGLPAAASLASGIRAPLVSTLSFRVSMETEHVDIARFPSPADEARRLRALFSSKYQQHFDLIIAVGNESMNFVLGARDELWPGIPVIVCAVDERSVGNVVLPGGVTLLTVRHNMEGTIRAALALLPQTNRIALVGGAGPQEQGLHGLAREAIRTVSDRLEIIDLTKLPIADLLARAASLPDDTFIYVSSYQLDGAGRRFYGLDILGPLISAANRPAFSTFSNAVGRPNGRGAVGGVTTDFEMVGRDAGEIAVRALAGESIPSILSRRAPGTPRFDARELARWNLDERHLPPGSEVVLRQATLWQAYRWHAIGVIVVIGAQGTLIVTLLVQRKRRREAQQDLEQTQAVAHRQMTQIVHLDRVAALGQLASSIAHELNQPLAGIQLNAEGAKRLLTTSPPDLDQVRECLGDIVSDNERASDVIKSMRRLLKRSESVCVPLALNDLAAKTIRLVAHDALLQTVTVKFAPAPALPAAYGDTVQIEQVILNLLTNAIAAAANGKSDQREVTVWTSIVTPPYVELGVHDSGDGIAETDFDRIFEPFFTSKPNGLGMGLTISCTIIEAHGGRLLVENHPAGGATFRVRLRTTYQDADATHNGRPDTETVDLTGVRNLAAP